MLIKSALRFLFVFFADEGPGDSRTGYFSQPPKRESEPPVSCGQWALACLLTGLIGMAVLAIWNWDVWKKFAIVLWAVLGTLLVGSFCVALIR